MDVDVISLNTSLYLATLGRKNIKKLHPDNEIHRKYNWKTCEACIFWEIQGRGTPHVEHVEVESLPSINSYLLSFTIIIKHLSLHTALLFNILLVR